MLDRIVELGWARRIKDTGVTAFSPAGEKALIDTFAVQLDGARAAFSAERKHA